MNKRAVGRQLPRIDHIAFLIRPENFDSAVRRMSDLLGLTFEGPYDMPERGIRICIDWNAGIEFISPTDPQIAAAPAAFIEEHGEGFYRLVLGVTDLESVLEHVSAQGISPGLRADGLEIDDAWRERFARIDEVTIGELAPGVFITLGQIETKQ